MFIFVDTSTCIASGDPHYKTFDGRAYDFMGNCSYLMSAPCNKTFVPYFEVHADNENRFNQFRISYLKAVHVYVHNVKISILKGGTVQVTALGPTFKSLTFEVLFFYFFLRKNVLLYFFLQLNGTNVNLPMSPVAGVSVFTSGKYYTVSTNFGLTVRYDGNHFMDIKVIKE